MGKFVKLTIVPLMRYRQRWSQRSSLGDAQKSMANYWVITIGINQYRHLQPLMHAQNDALFAHRFFTEAGIPSDHCILLSDLATSVAQQVVYPDKAAIAAWLKTITQQIQPDDVLWFFFSGYGAQVRMAEGPLAGQQADYLMPIDGDPGQIEKTGIALADVIDSLAELPTQKTLLVLDINRSQGALAGQAIGTQVIDLAQKRQVSTLLSCQPEQYSHETLGVRHGLFTAALLEALQQNCKTPSQISDYLNQRLPELCEHHWRPIQNPVSILAEHQAAIEMVPDAVSAAIATNEPTGDGEPAEFTESSSFTKSTESTRALESTESADVSEAAEVTAGAMASMPSANTPATETEGAATSGGYRSRASLTPDRELNESPEQGFSNSNLSRSKGNREEEEAGDLASAISGAKLRNWGMLALALLVGGVLLKQPFVRAAWDGLFEAETQTAATKNQPQKLGTASGEAANGNANKGTAADVAGTQAGDKAASDPLKNPSPNSPAAGSQVQDPAATKAQSPEAKNAEAKNAEAKSAEAKSAEAKSADKNNATTAEEKASAQKLIAQANAALSQKQYSEALITLQQVPKSQRDEKFSAVLTQARAGAAAAQQANASVLTEARTAIQPTQASQFTEAIAKARLIKPGEPYYEAAQADIRSWSQIILDIAEGRATSGSLDSAIAAAKVMPLDNVEFHQKAQDRIVFWQQRQQSRNVIADAQKIPKLGEASTYQQGIVKLREVPIEHPEYEAAQRLADQWSESIFSIAQARAAQGRDRAAIQAAVLVPAGTTAYEPTQQAIRRWREASGE